MDDPQGVLERFRLGSDNMESAVRSVRVSAVVTWFVGAYVHGLGIIRALSTILISGSSRETAEMVGAMLGNLIGLGIFFFVGCQVWRGHIWAAWLVMAMFLCVAYMVGYEGGTLSFLGLIMCMLAANGIRGSLRIRKLKHAIDDEHKMVSRS
jgi:hypothetical protein